MTEQKEPELIDVLDTFYEEDPVVGDVVLIRHNFENLNVAGEIVAMKRSHPHRGYDPVGDYEVVVYHAYKIQFPGIKQWFKIGDDEEWSLVMILDEKEYKKLSADVVLQSKVDDLIQESGDDDEL